MNLEEMQKMLINQQAMINQLLAMKTPETEIELEEELEEEFVAVQSDIERIERLMKKHLQINPLILSIENVANHASFTKWGQRKKNKPAKGASSGSKRTDKLALADFIFMSKLLKGAPRCSYCLKAWNTQKSSSLESARTDGKFVIEMDHIATRYHCKFAAAYHLAIARANRDKDPTKANLNNDKHLLILGNWASRTNRNGSITRYQKNGFIHSPENLLFTCKSCNGLRGNQNFRPWLIRSLCRLPDGPKDDKDKLRKISLKLINAAMTKTSNPLWEASLKEADDYMLNSAHKKGYMLNGSGCKTKISKVLARREAYFSYVKSKKGSE